MDVARRKKQKKKRDFLFREGVKTLRASESIGALTFGECAFSHDLHPHISLTTDSLSLS